MTVLEIYFCGINIRMQECLLSRNSFLIAARQAARRGAIRDAEMRYRQALNLCCKHSGRRSAAYGLVLFELSDFYQQQKRIEDSDQCFSEIRKILTTYYQPEKTS